MNGKEYTNIDREMIENLSDIVFNIAIKSIKDHKFKENLSYEEFKKEIKIFNTILIDNPLRESIPYVKKEDRKQILEEYKKIMIDFVTFTHKINEFTLNKKDIENMSIEEKKDIIKDYLLD